MRPPAAPRRRRPVCRCPDKYLLFASAAFIAFVLLVNMISQAAEQQIHIFFDTPPQSSEEGGGRGGKAALPAHFERPWTPSEVNAVDLSRRQVHFTAAAAADVLALLGNDPSMRFAFMDIALLSRGAEPADVPEAVEATVTAALVAGGTLTGLLDALGAADSAQAVLRLRSYHSEADTCEQQRRRLLRDGAALLTGLTAAQGGNWSLRFAVDRGAGAVAVATAVVESVTREGVSEPLDVSSLEYLLNAWILQGGQRSAGGEPLRSAYASMVEVVVRQRFRTIRTRAANYTYVSDSGSGVFHPSMCGLPAILARGIRHGAHPPRTAPVGAGTSAPLPGTAPLTSDVVLQAAEALAATCLRLYADPSTHHFQDALRYVPPVPGTGADKGVGPAPFVRAAAVDTAEDRCGMPVRLLRSFYELYLYTLDGVYGALAAYVMSPEAPHCPVLGAEGGAGDRGGLTRYAAELRYFALLALALECNLYRGSVGARGVCTVRSSTIVSPRHHLILLPPP